MSGGTFSSVLISLVSLLVAFFFNNDPPSSEHNPPFYVENPSTTARDIIRQVHEAISSSNATLVVELGIRGKLIATQIFNQCNNETADDAIKLHNWGGNFLYSTQNIQYPRTTAQVQQIVQKANKLRVIGSRHSFTKIGDSKDTIISTLGMNSILSLNTTVPSVTVQAGITYTDLAPFLQSVGFALPNLAALAEISIGGSISTGTHGSGLSHQNLPSQVLSMQLVLANGTVATYKKGDPKWNGLAVGLGAFGVMTQIELKLEPTYNVTTQVYMNMPLENLWANFDAIMNLGYTVQLFSSMTNSNSMDQVWVNVRVDKSGNPIGNLTELFGAIRAPTQVSPIAILPATYLIEQGVEHPWYQGLTDYGFGLSGADGNEIQSEYIIPYEMAVPALQAVNTLNAIISPILYVWFIRTIKADNFWLSQNEGGNSHLSIHFTFQPNITAVLEVLPQIDAILQPFNVRPHWGKLFTMKPDNFLNLYPKLDKFKELAQQLDPNDKFRNEFLDQNVFVKLNSTTIKSS